MGALDEYQDTALDAFLAGVLLDGVEALPLVVGALRDERAKASNAVRRWNTDRYAMGVETKAKFAAWDFIKKHGLAEEFKAVVGYVI